MVDLNDLFEIGEDFLADSAMDRVGHGAKIGELGALRADSNRRLTQTGDRLRELENRYERMRLITTALWQLLKAHTGLTDADLERYIEFA